MNVYVGVRAASVGGVAIQTVQGYTVDHDLEAIAASLSVPFWGNGYDEIVVETGPELGERELADVPNAYSVVMTSFPDGTAIGAPVNVGVARH
ncbi:hypothetical protein [Agromyces rhizosphaerae]|nr:hypothetical protein [Agromyces rhizosphaerae]